MTDRTIGSLNGPWAILAKLCLASFPLILVWGGWVTVGIVELRSFQKAGDRFTRSDGQALYRELDARLDNLPPAHVEEALRDNAREIRDTKDLLQQFERDFSSNFIRKSEIEMILKNSRD